MRNEDLYHYDDETAVEDEIEYYQHNYQQI